MKNNNETAKTDEYFKSNINNMVSYARNKSAPKFSAFLDERQQQMAQEILNSTKYKNYSFFGGTSNCERVILGVFPEGQEIEPQLFPIIALRACSSDKAKLSHRDFLGSLMGLQIKRESIGDILIDDGTAIIFAHEDVADFILFNLDKVGKAAVKMSVETDINIEKKLEFEAITGTVSSLRLDCIVALLLNKSRTIAVAAIEQGIVKLNCIECKNVSKAVNENDVIVIRGKGKFVLTPEIKKTKKDRCFITVNKLV